MEILKLNNIIAPRENSLPNFSLQLALLGEFFILMMEGGESGMNRKGVVAVAAPVFMVFLFISAVAGLNQMERNEKVEQRIEALETAAQE